ncbi:MAG: divergent polysaccharide deacetylase family protein [Gammaproteobacteria bacterium]
MRNGFPGPTACLLVLIFCLLPPGKPGAEEADVPAISIIIDDIGYRHTDDINALTLPGPVTYAILPHSPNAKKMSQLASTAGKDIILHIPMEAVENEKNGLMGPGGLTQEMDKLQFITSLSKSFRSVPNIIGVNNHMGSLLTTDGERMDWLMEYLRMKQVFYIDSLTSNQSVASLAAGRKAIPYLKRDVFLDNSIRKEDIVDQFNELIRIAKRRGFAIAIGHPHPETIEILADNLNRLDEFGVRMISLQDLVNQQLPRNYDYKKISQR